MSLDNVRAPESSSRARRLRGAKCKRRLWFDKAALLHTWSWQNIPSAPGWQPEPECAFNGLLGYDDLREMLPAVHSRDSLMQHASEMPPDTRFAFSSDVAKVTEELDALVSGLCDRLYSSSSSLCDAVASMHDAQLVEDGVYLQSVERPISPCATDREGSALLDETAAVEYLQIAGPRLADLLERFRQCGDVAVRIECGDLSAYDVEEAGENSMAAFLYERFRWEVPEGIAQRRSEDDEYEKAMEEEDRDMRRARLGHMFTFNRQHFWKLLGNIPTELRKELVEFGLTHPPRFTDHVIEPSAFEEVYFNHDEAAFCWQEEWSDEHEDDDLLVLIRLLRKVDN